MSKPTFPLSLLKVIIKAAPTEVKERLNNESEDGTKAPDVVYTPANNYLLFNWAVLHDPELNWNNIGLNEIDVAKLYFQGTYTHLGPDTVYTLLTGKAKDSDISDWIYANHKFLSREQMLAAFLKRVSTWSSFIEPLMLDTANFILTGKRQMPIRLMQEMMLEHYSSSGSNRYDGPHATPLIIRPRADLKELYNLTRKEFFLKWVRTPGGLNDIIATHRMLCGNAN